MARVWVSIGSNQDKVNSVRGAVRSLRKRYGPLILSPIYESKAVGFEGDSFLNLVAGFDTREPVSSLIQVLRDIEESHGRVRGTEKFSPRTLDIDLLAYGDRAEVVDGYELPRDEILKYDFVLRPLAVVAGDERHPVDGRSYGELWRGFEASSADMKEVKLDLAD